MAILASSALVAAAGALVIATVGEFGPLSLQMLQHLAIMNVLAPLVALLLSPRRERAGPHWIGMAGLFQLVLLWAWHAPAMQQAAAGSSLVQSALLVLLGGAAVQFWRAVLAAGPTGGWHALAALMLTGKFACLLGALLIFAPRDLYGLPGLVLALCATGPSTLADQQLAGLLMITACPLSYLGAGVMLAARMLRGLDIGQVDGDVPARPR